jgi:hypothetical protein
MPKTARILLVAAASASGALGACSSNDAIRCATNDDCLQGGIMGQCLDSPASSARWCAFSDPNCPGSALRWGRLSGDDLGSECVASSGVPIDLSVSVNGGGTGKVVSDPAGIDCGTLCSASFPSTATVSLTAVPDASSWFMGFDGDCSGRSPCTIAGVETASASARFEPHGKTLLAGSLGNTLSDRGQATAIAKDGSLYVGGTGGAFEGGYDGQIVIAKLDPATGMTEWTRFFTDGSAGQGSVRAIAVDPENGDVVIAGWLSGEADFDGQPVDPLGGDLYVARLDPSNGAVIWMRQVGASKRMSPSSVDDAPFGLAIDASGNEIVAATTSKAFVFGNDSVSYRAGTDAVLVKLGKMGAPIFARGFGGPGDDLATTVATDPAGDIYVGGSFEDTVTFSPGVTKSSAGAQDGFLSKWTSAGTHAFTRTFGSEGADYAASIVSGGDAIFVTGAFVTTVNLGGFEIRSTDNTQDVFVASYSTSGIHRWSRGATGGGTEGGLSLCMDDDGSVVLALRFSAGVSVDGYSAVNAGAAVATLSSASGALLHGSGFGFPQVTSVACGPQAILATGAFTGQVEVDGHVFMAAGNDLIWQTLVP